MKIKCLCFLTLLLMFVTVNERIFSQNSQSKSQLNRNNQQIPKFIDFCKVINNPQKYNGQVFSTRATYVQTFDSTILISSNCIQKETVVDAYLDCNSEDSCKALNQKIPLNIESGDLFGRGIKVELNLIGKLVVNDKNKTLSFYIKDVKSSEDTPRLNSIELNDNYNCERQPIGLFR